MLRALIIVVFVTLLSPSAFAERRVALVMGADDYEFARSLDNAVNDARAIEAALEALGFDVSLETDRDLKRMRRALEDFREDAAGADVALVFFAGHGVEIAGENRLLPVDASVATLADLKDSTLPLEEVRDAVAAAAPVGLILLDACRNDPFGSTGGKGRGAVSISPEVLRVVTAGLGRLGRAENILFAFSAAPGETASDGKGNSPFTAALTKYLGTEGLEIRSVLTLVQQEVYDLSQGGQLPYVESGLPELFFAAGSGGALPERERLLLAMADVTPDIRAEVEQIAGDAGMPLAPLYGALIETGGAALTAEERAAKLHEAADAFVKVRDELKTMASSDPEVTRLRGEAERELSLGAFDTARARLGEAADLDSRSREALKANFTERTLSEAATRYISGGAAKAELRYDLAIGDMEHAIALFAEAGDAALAPEHADRRLSALFSLGGMYVTVGNTAAAARAYELLETFMQKRIEGDADLNISRDLAITHMKLGNVQETKGNLSAALEHFQGSRDIMIKVLASEPDNAEWQSDLAVAYEEIGDVLVDQGDLTQAIGVYGDSLEIKQKLLAAHPDDLAHQRDLTTTYDALAGVLREMGKTDDALDMFNTSLEMRQAIVASDPDHFGRRRDLSISYDKVGDMLREKQDYDGALTAYRTGRDIVLKLAERDPNERQYRRDVSVAGDKIGNVLDDQGDLDGALRSYSESNAIISALAASDPDNMTWQRDLSVSLEKVADNLRKQGDLDAGLVNYEQSLVIVRKMVASDPTNANWQRDLSITLSEIGNIHVDLRHLQPAADALKEALAIREQLAAAAPNNARWQRDLAIALADWAQVAPKKRAILERALGVMTTLRDNGQAAPDDQMIVYLEKRLARLKG